jgi:predicted RNase H-like HicB family nuclease
MQRIFEGETREEANRKADEWWDNAEGVRFIHRSQIPAGFRSNHSSRWVIAIHYKEEALPS